MARDKANIEDAAMYLVAVSKIAEVEAWKKERLTQVRQQVEAEAGRRIATYRGEAGAAIVRMKDRGETLTTIAVATEAAIGELRAVLRHVPKTESERPSVYEPDPLLHVSDTGLTGDDLSFAARDGKAANVGPTPLSAVGMSLASQHPHSPPGDWRQG